jgi:hypothetical protein
MPPVGFEPAIPVSERPQTHALDRAVTAIGPRNVYLHKTQFLQISSYPIAASSPTFPNQITTRNGEVPCSARSPNLSACGYCWGVYYRATFMLFAYKIHRTERETSKKSNQSPSAYVTPLDRNVRSKVKECLRKDEGRI